MIKPFLTLVCLLYVIGSAQATISINGDFGILKTANGAAVVPQGGLLQLIATPSGSISNFSAPTAGSFVSGDNIIVASFSMNYNSGVTGETTNLLTNITLQNTGASSPTMFDAGDPLLLRWYPTLTTASTAPGAGATYGQFRTDTAGDGGNAWITPANGTNNYAITLITVSDGGMQANTAGYANSVVVPEPSTAAISGVGAFALLGLALRSRFGKQVA